MFIDARTLPQGTNLNADICVIGSGAAGIAIATDMIGRNLRVVVLESGGFDFDPAVQDMHAGVLKGPGPEPIDVSRLRYFGGTTNHWAGWCRPLDPIDFESRAGIPLSGWPITRSSLDPWYARAMALCELGANTWENLAAWLPQGARAPAFDPERLVMRLFQVSPPTRFGIAYRPTLEADSFVSVYLNATVTALRADPTAQHVTRIDVACLDGPRFSVTPRLVVLASGGIENARLLLLSRDVQAQGLGNGHDMVGRCFMDHPWVPLAGVARFAGPTELPLLLGETEVDGTTAFATLAPGPALLRSEAIGNFRTVLRPLARVPIGMDSLRSLIGAAATLTWPDAAWTHLRGIFADADLGADRLYRLLTGSSTSPFTSPPPPGAPPQGALIDINMEQLPNLDSRVTLGEARDALGQRRVIVDWRLGETERVTLHRALVLLGLEFGRLGIGRVNIAGAQGGWPPDLRGSRHHMGTTRMSTGPRSGVVDTDCRVHGMTNLYIAGSSVFPTGGAANPTLTIVALALRLSETLRRRLG